MPNTSLSTNIQPGGGTIISDANTVHAEINRLSRDTGSNSVQSRVVNGWTAAGIAIRRQDDSTTITVINLNGSSSTDATFLPFVESAPGVSIDFVGNAQRRSPKFELLDGGGFYFVITEGGLRCFFTNGATSTGTYAVAWTFSHSGTWPSFLPAD